MNKKVPEFRSTEEERAYWAEVGSVDDTGLREDRTSGAGGLKLPEAEPAAVKPTPAAV